MEFGVTDDYVTIGLKHRGPIGFETGPRRTRSAENSAGDVWDLYHLTTPFYEHLNKKKSLHLSYGAARWQQQRRQERYACALRALRLYGSCGTRWNAQRVWKWIAVVRWLGGLLILRTDSAPWNLFSPPKRSSRKH